MHRISDLPKICRIPATFEFQLLHIPSLEVAAMKILIITCTDSTSATLETDWLNNWSKNSDQHCKWCPKIAPSPEGIQVP